MPTLWVYIITAVSAVAARVEELFTENIKVIVNLNVFAILAENKRVDIAIADNKVKIYINILPNV
jgi:hypothetical protein